MGNEQLTSEKPYKDYIGVMDSGVGGISVLKEIHKLLPRENIVYFGDSAYAPYGEKTRAEVLDRTKTVMKGLLSQGVKAVVIACNTATSAAAAELREEYPDLPIIGVEPAIKPAALSHQGERVLVMATPMTIQLEKYQSLSKRFEQDTEVISLACHGLAKTIEKGEPDGPEVKSLLNQLLHPYRDRVDAVVLGCTHYPFVREQIREILGDVEFYDGGYGTAMEVERELDEKGLLNTGNEPGEVVFLSSEDTPEELALYQSFFTRE